MGPVRKSTSFQEDWLKEDDFSLWLQPSKMNKNEARCSFCQKTFSLSNMGRRAVTSHMTGEKHKIAVKNSRTSVGLNAYLTNQKKSQCEKDSACRPTSITPPSVSCVSSYASTSTVTNQSGELTVPEHKEPYTMKTFLSGESVTRAEIIWCLSSVMSHKSLRCAANDVSVFPLMFPDSDIASKMQLQRTKIGYVILQGLAPYFHNELKKELVECSEFVVGFDESLNKVAQLGQMDLVVRFWNEDSHRISTRYFSSQFLNHATSADLLQAFTQAFPEFDMSKIVQVSMDGPNVNIKFLRDLSASLATDPNSPILLDIGTCGLHSVHGAFKAGMKATEWELITFLRALYVLFRDVPARRGDFTHFSGSTVFPLKFCSIRWVENGKVARRAVEMLPKVIQYVDKVGKDPKLAPKCNSFHNVASALKDGLLICKLTFFQTVANEVEPFLTKFQSDSPLAPLLYESLKKILRVVFSRFVKEESLNATDCITSIDISDSKNLLTAKEVDLGFATIEALRKVKHKVKEIDVLRFRQECRTCLQVLCKKLLERSPLKYALTKSISCLDPEIALHSNIRDKRLKSTLQHLVQKRHLAGIEADAVQRQFMYISETDVFNEELNNFSREEGRLDDLWMQILTSYKGDKKELEKFVKKILILSHGNARLERGFSVNKECVVENQKEESLIAQRQIHDAVSVLGGVHNVVITKPMIHAVRSARTRYQEALDSKKEKVKAQESAEKEKKRISLEILELEKKKKALIESAQKETAMLEEEIKSLKGKK